MQCDVVDINELALNRQILSDINYVIEWLREDTSLIIIMR